ncbi:PAAR domain-containing protein [Cupriavidus numazuensis]|uniref:PAAR domain-containing protein n=1 Tax=Cupriavidus numazuensis TaxID=221992 RepID=A0ABM8TAC8_9BURK|nr:PAAR domain-containing protein [Cupriavidus numazuensis]CAG2130738.1 hypothetical protein LMG26411_00404 [Cupriavidus numazuensis]
MPDTRYFLKHGDRTSTGGQLIAIRPNFAHHGVAMGIEGDIATCPVCKSSGPVFNDCYPSCDYHGTQVLVNGARVYCKCAEHPTVFNTQRDSTVEVNRSARYSPPLSASNSYRAEPSALQDGEEIIEQYYELIDASTGEPASGYRHDLFIDGERVSQDMALNGGRSATVRGGLSTRIVIWLDKSQETRA